MNSGQKEMEKWSCSGQTSSSRALIQRTCVRVSRPFSGQSSGQSRVAPPAQPVQRRSKRSCTGTAAHDCDQLPCPLIQGQSSGQAVAKTAVKAAIKPAQRHVISSRAPSGTTSGCDAHCDLPCDPTAVKNWSKVVKNGRNRLVQQRRGHHVGGRRRARL